MVCCYCFLCCCCLVVVTLAQITQQTHCQDKQPVIHVPGFAGSSLQVTVDGQTTVPECPASGDFEFPFLPSDTFSEECMYKLLKLNYDPVGEPHGTFSNQPGVTVKLPDIGYSNCTSVIYTQVLHAFDPWFDAGFVEGQDLHVFCYDWRLAPDISAKGSDQEQTATSDLPKMIANVYKQTQRRVFLIGHSYGSFMALAAIHSMTQEDRDKYIAGLVLGVGGLVGLPVMIRDILSGALMTLTPGTAPCDFTTPTWESWPAVYVMLPAGRQYEGRTLVTDTSTNTSYGVSSYEQLFHDAGRPVAQQLYKKFAGRYDPERLALVVDTYAFVGVGTPTALHIAVEGLDNPEVSVVESLDGDGFVDHLVVEAMRQGWGHASDPTAEAKFKFHVYELQGDHLTAVQSALPDLLELVGAGVGQEECRNTARL